MKAILLCLAAALVAAAITLPHDNGLLAMVSVAFGAAGLVLLAVGAKDQPVLALTLWGAVFVSMSGAWVLPAFESPIEVLSVLLGLAFCGALFYGGAAGALSFFFTGRFSSLRFLVLPLSIPLAEYFAMRTGLVMAPVGLLAVSGGWAWGVAHLGAVAFGGVMMGLVTLIARINDQRLRTTVALMVVLVALVPPPVRPIYNGSTITVVAHSPDPAGKWTAEGAQMALDILLERSGDTRGQGLTVWPENAVSGTFSVEEALDLLEGAPRPLLFGMTRYVVDGSPALRNSAILVDGEDIQISDKIQLAPLVEAGLPFATPSHLQPGERRLMVLGDSTVILPLICYEIAFPVDVTNVAQRPDIIITIAAQTGFIAWMAEVIAARHARARELETGIRVVRVSDVGPT